MASQFALLLNANYEPIKLVPWERAIVLLLDETVDLVCDYATDLIRTVSRTWGKPAVIRLRKYVKLSGHIRFNRQNVLARDGYTCMYCGARPMKAGRPHLEDLTLDHVVPRAQSKGGKVTLPWSGAVVPVTSWQNVCCACYSCNNQKADRTPQQAGLKLRATPRAPSQVDVLRMALTRVHIPPEWREYLPSGSEWRGAPDGTEDYWTVPLDED